MLPETSVIFHIEDEKLQRLYDAAVAKCRLNLQQFGSHRVLVEGGGYEKIWLETQPMGGEMYAAYDLQAAVNNQLLFMRTQRVDGRLAGSIQCVDGEIEPQFNKLQGFCFPHPALNLYWWLGEDRAYLDELARTLESFDAWLWRTRDSDGDGCLESFCVYDTGEDNALRYGDAPNYCETDTPPANSRVVPMASMDVMSYSYACRDTLAEISCIRQDGQEAHWRDQARQVAAALKAHLWDEERGACFDRDKAGSAIDVLCHNNLRCMYWGSFSQEMADRFVKEHLLRADEFWTPLPLPSVAAKDPLFRNAPENNWSGQCEGLTYQRAMLALERYGYDKLAVELGRKLMQAVIDGGYLFTQQFDPFTGAPSRVSPVTKAPLPPKSDEPCQDAYGPTLLAVMAYMARTWGVTLQRGQVWCSACRGKAFTYELRWGRRVFRMESDGVQAQVLFDGKEVWRGACGARVVLDQAGNVLHTKVIE